MIGVIVEEWYWKCLVMPWSVRVLAVLLAAISVMVVWSECLFFIQNPVLSIFAQFLDLARRHYTYATIEVSKNYC
jgi:hypothetical protein